MPKDRPLPSAYRITVSQLDELLDLADFPEVGTAIRVRIRKLVREVFDLHTRLQCQEDKWPIFREKLVEIFPPLRNFPYRIEMLQAYARRTAVDQICHQISRTSRKRQLSLRYEGCIKQESGTQVLVHDQRDCEEIPTQGRVSTAIYTHII